MIATLSTCAQLERDNISFRLQSGRKRYIEKGGKLGRKVGSVKTAEQMKAEYREVISLLRKGYSIRDVAMDVAQITLMSDDLLALPEAVKLSQKTVHMIWQNLFWAFIYNIICIPLAAGALHIFGIDFQITPMWASALMAFSSVSVVLNSLRLRMA